MVRSSIKSQNSLSTFLQHPLDLSACLLLSKPERVQTMAMPKVGWLLVPLTLALVLYSLVLLLLLLVRVFWE